ncbi:hypothetical protein LGT39_08015 [Demequina sp. TTPB684]|uniref:hypothetical protein n=1 Tax=unclassified Demequina TaxID=2620311 RepID=UPI001CF3D91B|nr:MULTISPECIES: hypothetical protein [unclassified Demequina]MCB2412789.1 hypothetical protein [Demequina sp. TTPB684]UPU87136.1 hypothetical protein LGT36_007550 [Demequina sp. TMPB413]
MTPATAGTTEFDRFGPWIDEVTHPDDLPRLYRGHPIDFAAERLVLKVPRNISRRNATADMDLYDHLVILGRERLTVLSRRAGDYDTVTMNLTDVVAMRNTVNLLNGRLAVASSTGESITVPYNGSAAPMVDTLVSALREVPCSRPASSIGAALREAGKRFARPTLGLGTTWEARPTLGLGTTQGLGLAPDNTPIDTFLVSAFLEAKASNPDLAAWAAHGRRPLSPATAGLRGVRVRLQHALKPMTLHGALITADDTTLELHGRHDWLVRGRDAIYSTTRLVIPFAAPDRLELAPHPLYPDAVVATVGAGVWREEIPVPRGSAAETLLRKAATVQD